MMGHLDWRTPVTDRKHPALEQLAVTRMNYARVGFVNSGLRTDYALHVQSSDLGDAGRKSRSRR
jgi:hypothetical protein